MSSPDPEAPAPLDAADFSARFAGAAARLWAWAALRLGPRLRVAIDTDDLVQEVALRAWRVRERFDPERGPFEGWLFGIARNTLREVLARVATGGARVEWSTTGWAALPDDATRATRAVARDEQLAAVVAWVEELEEEERALVLRRGLESVSYAELAELDGSSEAAVRKRWERLRTRLGENAGLAALLGVDQS